MKNTRQQCCQYFNHYNTQQKKTWGIERKTTISCRLLYCPKSKRFSGIRFSRWLWNLWHSFRCQFFDCEPKSSSAFSLGKSGAIIFKCQPLAGRAGELINKIVVNLHYIGSFRRFRWSWLIYTNFYFKYIWI